IDPPAAPPEPPPIPPAPAPVGERATKSEASERQATQPPEASSSAETTAPVATPPPQRLWVVLDYYKEFGGTVIREDDASITLRTPDGEERRVDRNSIVSAVPLLDEPEGSRVIVRLRDGRELKGELVSDGFDSVITRIEGVRTSMPRGEVLSVVMEVPFEERLARFRARIPADAWDVRLELVRWLLSERRPDIALEELKEIRKNADSDDAARLMARAEAERDLMLAAARAKGAAVGRGGPDPARPELVRRLTDADVNLIRVMEIDLANPPRMHHPSDLPQRVQEAYATNDRMPPAGPERAAMATWGTPRLLELLFAMKARDLYGAVRVDEDPEHLRVYRKRVHDGWLIPNCATSRCHGGIRSGAFMLASVEPRDARTAYTNLLVLLGYRTAEGRPLVDFDDPAKSMLLSMGRPRNEATVPHPPVAGWEPLPASQRRAFED
ncbi:MAG: hypothetical protein EBU70_13180, partial [Actinobacteria bacterium]|nr:hypothetical protein [Actinomycetota bacterium]